ncbi:MAG: sensor domain-containing diguanylate cyclase [Chloroflexi bacterium]|nr:sensor domain-containing diguanylate cyclase [Chloroflexota bacterium]
MAGTPDFIALLSDADSLQLMLFACPDGVIATDRADDVLLYTGSSELMFGFSPIEVMRQSVRRLFATPDGYGHFRSQLERDSRVVNLEVLAARKDGPPFIAAFSAALIRDRYGSETGSVIYIRDHSKMRAIESALRDNNRRLNDLVRTLNHVAQHDQLTGMLYRGSAIEAAEAALLASGLNGAPFGVALFDLDHFKSVNDSYGHLVGDEVLASLADVLKSAARQDDIIGRFGGEEFISFLPDADLESVAAFAERVRVAIGDARVQVGNEVHINVTISAGVAAVPTCADSLQEAIRVADDRLLLAKRHGRNMVVADDALQEKSAA